MLYKLADQRYQDGDDAAAGEMSKLLDSLVILGQSHLTKLQLLRIAADCGFPPFPWHTEWRSPSPPPFTVFSGEIGRVSRHSSGSNQWKILEACNRVEDTRYVSRASPWSGIVIFHVV